MATKEAAMFCAQICKSGLELGAKLSDWITATAAADQKHLCTVKLVSR